MLTVNWAMGDKGYTLWMKRPEFYSSIQVRHLMKPVEDLTTIKTATAGSDVVQSGRPIFDDFFQHLWPYIGNNMANVVFQMVKRLWLIRIDQ
ncbi:hypothetical protein TNCV_3171471 [Trichonephila clavipes]|nr:hypothetical protein TNCV_3171471 [Trichonephila clavipes]